MEVEVRPPDVPPRLVEQIRHRKVLYRRCDGDRGLVEPG
jgi:hypothetical protein